MFPRTTRVALWVTGIGLLIALFVPFAPARQAATGATVGAIVILAVISVLELIYVFMKVRPGSTWTPGRTDQAEDRIHRVAPVDDDWTDDLVDGTAAGLIDWED